MRPTHLWLTHRPAPPPHISGCRVPRAKTPVPLLPSPSARVPPPPPHTHSTDSVASGHEHHATPCLDVTWGRTLRHYMGVRGGRAPGARTVTHSPGGGAGPDSTAPTAPALHTLRSAGSQRGAGGGGSPAPRPRVPSPLHLRAPPLPSRETRSCRKGASGNSLDPSARRCPVRPLPIHPPEGGARGRCPMERGGGRRLLREP